MKVMIIKLGDKVRSAGGVEGQVASINDDRLSVMVKVPGVWRGTGVVSIPVARLTKIDAYASESPRRRPVAARPVLKRRGDEIRQSLDAIISRS